MLPEKLTYALPQEYLGVFAYILIRKYETVVLRIEFLYNGFYMIGNACIYLIILKTIMYEYLSTSGFVCCLLL